MLEIRVIQRFFLTVTAVVLVLVSSIAGAAGPKISLVAIFKDKAMLNINGQRVMLNKDQAGPEGVVLRFTDTRSETVDVDINGNTETLRLGYVLSAGGVDTDASSEKKSVTLYSASNGFFHADGYINNIPIRFLIDTGASTVALNSETATRIGIDYLSGERAVAVTASGYAETYIVSLEEVEVGGMKLRHVDASVIEGPQPSTPLLGMSFLGQFDMRREGDRMELIER